MVGDSSFANVPYSICSGIIDTLSSIRTASPESLTVLSNQLVYLLLTGELFMSSGSLLYQLGYKLNPVFYDPNDASGSLYSFDQVFDYVFHICRFSLLRILI